MALCCYENPIMKEIIVKAIIKATVRVFFGSISLRLCAFRVLQVSNPYFFKKNPDKHTGFFFTNKTMRECGYKKLPHPQGSFLCTKFTLNEEY